MGVLILGVAIAMQRQFSLPKWNEWAYFALLEFLGVIFHQWLQSNGLQISEAGTTAWIVSTTSMFMALLGWIIPKEGLNWLKLILVSVLIWAVFSVLSRRLSGEPVKG